MDYDLIFRKDARHAFLHIKMPPIKMEMPVRLIDANALIPKMRNRFWKRGREGDAICLIEDAPTVDAVQVVHAYWIIKPHGTYDRLRAFCSACGKHSGIGGIESNQKKPYCPNCGAVMDGKEIVDG